MPLARSEPRVEKHRAAALPPEQRRAAIAAATLPLLVHQGPNVTTRQIAEASGIAEGTIFRVFRDKDAVIEAALELAFDTEPTERAIAEIDRSLPFERQLAIAVEIMQRRHADIWRLVSSLGGPAALGAKGPTPPADLLALAALFKPERARLRTDPATAAKQLRALTLAVSHPALYADEPMSPREVVSLLLDGIRRRPALAATRPKAAKPC
ncbi:MAG: hypothetical protein AVDCRST_MAG50-2433 [uncultured Acidimicrobiales bacterium]|uniref:HTH tetR-type domain-containing protein n=1 Tax=uncultured Acidimicrobiales bacterium TaxID=310071 RepID=A0A6J4IKH4_9ACTN|nr:MAG: hypothetical protein AVDCRST_MAG50-2433 [uncultured Acidimicrobiales bacterium]